MHHVILRDCDHPRLSGDDYEQCPTLGEHDQEDEDPHCHYSILAVENGLVVNADWGYHTEDEARDHVPVPVICMRCGEEGHGVEACTVRWEHVPGAPDRVTCPYPQLPEEYATILNASGASRCPNCGDETKTEYSDLHIDLGIVSQRATCSACDFVWFDVYHLVRYDPLEV